MKAANGYRLGQIRSLISSLGSDVKVSMRDEGETLLVTTESTTGAAKIEAALITAGFEYMGRRFTAGGSAGVPAGEVYGGRWDFRHKYIYAMVGL